MRLCLVPTVSGNDLFFPRRFPYTPSREAKGKIQSHRGLTGVCCNPSDEEPVRDLRDGHGRRYFRKLIIPGPTTNLDRGSDVLFTKKSSTGGFLSKSIVRLHRL